MAFGSTTVWEVQSGGADGNSGNGGGFDPGNASMATNLAATSATTTAPVVSSATYNFQARDVGHWLFVKSGTNWRPGWYKISSVASNQATLDATAGNWVDYTTLRPGTVNGCASVASPTTGTWSVDYSQTTAAGISFSDLAVGATATQFTSAGNPVGPNMVGNVIAVSAGTGFTVQRVQITSVAGTTATVDKTFGGTSLSGGVGILGGCLASPGQAGALKVTSNSVYVKAGTYTMSGSANTAGGPVTDSTGGSAATPTRWTGYNAKRGDDGTQPVLSANAASVVCFTASGSEILLRNLKCNNAGANATCTGFTISGTQVSATLCTVTGLATGFGGTGGVSSHLDRCLGDGNTNNFTFSGHYFGCVARNGGGTGIQNSQAGGCLVNCLAHGNAGIGVQTGGNSALVVGCTSYGNTGGTSHGFDLTGDNQLLVNCLSAKNGGVQYNESVGTDHSAKLVNCASWANGLTDHNFNADQVHGFVTLTGDPTSAPGGNDFSLNNTAGAGKLCRAAGVLGAFPGISTTSYPDLGAAQSQAGGGGGPVVGCGFIRGVLGGQR